MLIGRASGARAVVDGIGGTYSKRFAISTVTSDCLGIIGACCATSGMLISGTCGARAIVGGIRGTDGKRFAISTVTSDCLGIVGACCATSGMLIGRTGGARAIVGGIGGTYSKRFAIGTVTSDCLGIVGACCATSRMLIRRTGGRFFTPTTRSRSGAFTTIWNRFTLTFILVVRKCTSCTDHAVIRDVVSAHVCPTTLTKWTLLKITVLSNWGDNIVV